MREKWKLGVFWALFILSPAVLLIGLEGGARFLTLFRPSTPPPLIEPDRLVHHRFRPDGKYVGLSRRGTIKLSTNSAGFPQSREVTPDKPVDTYRILYLGDSNTVGVVNEPDKMIERVRQALLVDGSVDGKHLEFINAGTMSYSILIYYLKLQRELLAYHPDLVVLNVDMSDVPDDFTYRNDAKYGPDGSVVALDGTGPTRFKTTVLGPVALSFAERAYDFLNAHSLVFSKITWLLAKPAQVWTKPPGENSVQIIVSLVRDRSADWLAHAWSPEVEQNVAFSMGYLGRTLDMLREKGIRVVVTGVPHYPQFTGEWSVRPHEVLRKTALAHGALFLDTYAALKGTIERTPQDRYYWDDDPTHFNVDGNRIWAEVQTAFLRDHREELRLPATALRTAQKR